MLEAKVIVVTGGAGLLGREFAKAIALQRGTAILADVALASAEAALADLLKLAPKSKSTAYAVDITQPESVEALVGETIKRYGRIDGLVNAAYPRTPNYAPNHGRQFFDVEYGDFCANIDAHLGGYFLTCQRFSKAMSRTGGGSIVNIASIYGVIAPRFEIYEGTSMTMPVEYAVIKAGIIQLTRYLAKLLKGTGVRVNSVSPGGIEDGQPAVFLENYRRHCQTKGMLDRTDISGTLIYLLSDWSAFVTGQNIVVDDGFTL
ncbi:MAG: SDR family oxidoreductase [Betaproteobacteria bacterium]|nr:SDR family oxidoreductase [Betaproteobacteria bacterium]